MKAILFALVFTCSALGAEAVVPPALKAVTVVMLDGEIIQGYFVGRDATTFTIQASDGKATDIAISKIKKAFDAGTGAAMPLGASQLAPQPKPTVEASPVVATPELNTLPTSPVTGGHDSTVAANPEGSGSITFLGAIAPSQSLDSGESESILNPAIGVQFPLGHELGLRVTANWKSIKETSSWAWDEGNSQSDSYQADVALTFYTGGIANDRFIPGVNANPDGWLYWPALSVDYSLQKYMQQYSNSWGYGDANFALNQNISLSLDEPVADWLTLEFGWFHNLQQVLTYSGWPDSTTNVLQSYTMNYGARFFFNLISGAGSDKSRPYIPHFGRLGQMGVELDWSHEVLDPTDPGWNVNTVGGQVFAPISDSLAVGLGYSGMTTAGALGYIVGTYSLQVTYAFGE